MADSHDISDSKSEAGRAMGGEGLVTFLKSVVLLDEMEVITSDDNGSLHLVGNNNTPKLAINSLLGSLLLISIVFWSLSSNKTRWNSEALATSNPSVRMPLPSGQDILTTSSI